MIKKFKFRESSVYSETVQIEDYHASVHVCIIGYGTTNTSEIVLPIAGRITAPQHAINLTVESLKVHIILLIYK